MGILTTMGMRTIHTGTVWRRRRWIQRTNRGSGGVHWARIAFQPLKWIAARALKLYAMPRLTSSLLLWFCELYGALLTAAGCVVSFAQCEEHDDKGPRTLRSAVANDLRTRGKEASAAQEALADASAEGDVAAMTDLLDAGLAKVNSTSEVSISTEVSVAGTDEDDQAEAHQWPSLHIAAQIANIETVTFLLDKGADPNFSAYTKKSLTTLMVAVMSGSVLSCSSRHVSSP